MKGVLYNYTGCYRCLNRLNCRSIYLTPSHGVILPAMRLIKLRHEPQVWSANHICVRADGGLLIVYRTHIDLNNLACVNPRIHHAAAAGLSSGFWQWLQYSGGGLSTRSPAAAVAASRLQQRRLQ